MMYLLEQWFIVTDYGDLRRDADNADLDGIEYEANCVKVSDIHNLIEQKFEELLMLVEMQLVMNFRNTKKHKKLSKK